MPLPTTTHCCQRLAIVGRVLEPTRLVAGQRGRESVRAEDGSAAKQDRVAARTDSRPPWTSTPCFPRGCEHPPYVFPSLRLWPGLPDRRSPFENGRPFHEAGQLNPQPQALPDRSLLLDQGAVRGTASGGNSASSRSTASVRSSSGLPPPFGPGVQRGPNRPRPPVRGRSSDGGLIVPDSCQESNMVFGQPGRKWAVGSEQCGSTNGGLKAEEMAGGRGMMNDEG